MKLRTLGLFFALPFFAVNPSSTNYNLKSFDVGGGGGGAESSTNYKLDGQASTLGGDALNSTNYGVDSGELKTQEANVPPAPVFTNPSSEYYRLRLTINTDNHPSDTKFLIAISPDAFATTTRYVQTDNSIGAGVTIANYQTYTAWGGASGFWVTGLAINTTYTVKIKALQGEYSGSPYGPTASASTIAPTVTFGVETTLTATPPFTVGFTSLTPGTVFSSNYDAIVKLTSNALYGGGIYVKDLNNGLNSASTSTTVSSATADLSVASMGYGAQVVSTSQSSGGPMTAFAPYASGGNQVGALSTGFAQIISTVGPVTTGQANIRLKAKVDAVTPSATDYTDRLTFVAAMQF